MAKLIRGASPTSVVLRVKLMDSSVTTGAGLTGLSSSSAGLIISTLRLNEAAPTVYTQAGGTIETIATLGTYVTPTATKCCFKEVDATNHPGLYELHFADARFTSIGLVISLSGATNLAQGDFEIQCENISVNAVQAGGQSITAAAGMTFGAYVGNATAPLFVGTDGSMKLGVSTATAVAAIQSGLSKPGTAQTITPADTAAATTAFGKIGTITGTDGKALSSSDAANATVLKSALTLPTGIKKNVALPFSFVMFKKGTNTPQAGLSPTVTLKLDAAAFAAAIGAVVEDAAANGAYNLTISQAEMNHNKIVFCAHDSSGVADDNFIEILPNA